MAKSQRGWYRVEEKQVKPKVPAAIKAELKAKADMMIETVLKPMHVKPKELNSNWNYITDICCKWHGAYFYFYAIYASDHEDAISPTFESKFARIEYIGENQVGISFMRHTGTFIELQHDISMEACLEAISEGGWFTP